MASAVLCVAFLLPSLVTHGAALRQRALRQRLPPAQQARISVNPQEAGPLTVPQRHQPGPQVVAPRDIEYQVDAAAIVFGAADRNFVVDACNVLALLISNGMQRDHIKLFLPGKSTKRWGCPDELFPDSNIGRPDFTTGSKIPVQALITGCQTDLKSFCGSVKKIDQKQRCSDELLPKARNLFFFFSGHGDDNPPGLEMDSALTWKAMEDHDEKMLPVELRNMVETGWPRAHGRLLMVVDCCHSALSFIGMLPVYQSNSDAVDNATEELVDEIEDANDDFVNAYGANPEYISDSIPVVVITSTGVQTCTTVAAEPREYLGSHFANLMIGVWNRAKPESTIAEWKNAIKRRSLINLVDDDVGREKVKNYLLRLKLPRRWRTSPKFFGYENYLSTFTWGAFKLAR